MQMRHHFGRHSDPACPGCFDNGLLKLREHTVQPIAQAANPAKCRGLICTADAAENQTTIAIISCEIDCATCVSDGHRVW